MKLFCVLFFVSHLFLRSRRGSAIIKIIIIHCCFAFFHMVLPYFFFKIIIILDEKITSYFCIWIIFWILFDSQFFPLHRAPRFHAFLLHLIIIITISAALPVAGHHHHHHQGPSLLLCFPPSEGPVSPPQRRPLDPARLMGLFICFFLKIIK